MKLKPEQLQNNWDIFLDYFNYIESPRKEQLLDLYISLEKRLILYPCSHKKGYHNCFPGGYILHVINVIKWALDLNQLWNDKHNKPSYTEEELVFSAINHDLGKIGTLEEPAYIPNDDKWRREKLGELYKFNENLPYMSVPDRSLFLLNQSGIPLSLNETLSIKLHDGLYDDANKQYLITYMPERKPKTSLVYILHSADMLSARMEFEEEFLNIKKEEEPPKENFKLKTSTKTQALKSIESKGIQDIFDKI